MDLYWPYLVPMLMVCQVSILAGLIGNNPPMARTAVVIALNWAVNTAFVIASGIYDPWYFFLVVDGLSAWAVLRPPAGRVQSLIGWTYIGQILIHVIYGLTNNRSALDAYLFVLDEIAFAQLIILGAWAGGYGGHRLWNSRRARLLVEKGREGLA